MIVEEMERRFFELKGKLDVGVVSEAEFKSEVQKLRFQDKQGRWWMLGAQSGKWYSYDGVRWVPGQPPQDAQSVSVPAAPAPVVAPPVPRPAVPPSPRLTLAKPEPSMPTSAVTAPPLPEHLTTAPRVRRTVPQPALTSPVSARRLPFSGPVLIVGAAVFALVGVLVLWFILDNFMPGKPISSFLGGLTGSQPAAIGTLAVQPSGGREVSALIAAGDQFVTQSQIDVAITQYQSAAQLAPNNVTPLVRWSRALAFKGLMPDALAKAQQAAQRAPSDAEAQAQFCRALAWNGQVNDAIAAGEKAVQLDSKNVNARANLAEAYLLARRTVDAQGAAYAALQVAPSSAEAHRAQAWALTIQGQKENALNEWKQTVSLEPNFYFRHFEFGEVLRLYLNSPADAVAEHQKAVSLYGAYIPAISRLGLALLAANKPQDAIAPFQRTITLDPRNVDGYAYLGVAFGQTNRCTQAIPYFEQALKLDANNSLAQSGLANCKAGKAPTLPQVAPLLVPLTPPTLVPGK